MEKKRITNDKRTKSVQVIVQLEWILEVNDILFVKMVLSTRGGNFKQLEKFGV